MGDIRSGRPPGPGPVFTFEWMRSARRWQGYVLRSLFVAMLLAALSVVWSGRNGKSIAPTIQGLASLGEVFFQAVVGTQLTLVLLAAPAATAGSICLDRARGTLTHLLVTDLSDAEIVLGKLAARLVPVISMIVCTFPVMTLLTLLGGVDSDALLGAFLVTLGIAVLGSSLALTFSLWAGKTHEALLGTYSVWGLWQLGPLMINSLGGLLGVTIWAPPLASDPFQLAFAPYNSPGSVGLGDYLCFLGVTWAVSAGLAALAIVRLRSVCARDPVPRRRPRAFSWWRDSPWFAKLGGLAARWPAPSLDSNPVLWREWHRNRPSAWARSVAALFVALSVVFGVVSVVSGPRSMPQAVCALQVSVGMLLLSVTASNSLAEERARGSLDVLMATPLSSRQIVLGKWLGAFRLVPALALLPALLVFAELGWKGMRWPLPAAILMAAYVISVGAAVTSLGITLATWCSRLGRAVGLTVTAYVIVTVGWMFLVMSMTGPQPYGYPIIAASPFFGPIVIVSLYERSSFDWSEFVAVVLWIATYAMASVALLSSTLATFDRRLGRIHCSDQGVRRGVPKRAESVTVEQSQGPELARS